MWSSAVWLFVCAESAVIMKALLIRDPSIIGRQHHGNDKGDAQCNRNGNGESANEFSARAAEQQQRQEGRDDGQRCGQHRNRHVSCASPASVRNRHLMIEQFDVVIGNHDGVIDHHAQHDNECGNGNLVQLDPRGIEHAEGDWKQ